MTDHAPHVTSTRTYVATFAALWAFTALTTGAAFINFGRLDTGPIHEVVALAIAIAKASLVVAFFMHVRHASGLTRIFIAAGIFWLAILMLFTFADIVTRTRAVPGRSPAVQDVSHLYTSPNK